MGGQLKKPPCMSWTSYLRSKHFSECRCRQCIKSRTLFGDSFLRLPPRLKVITQVFPIYSPPELGLFCPYTPNRPWVQLDYLDHIAHNLLPHQVRKPIGLPQLWWWLNNAAQQCNKGVYVVIPIFSPLQSKALFTFEFIGLRTSTL